jgi:5-methylcytosine-specific restriction endonuclease McrA
MIRADVQAMMPLEKAYHERSSKMYTAMRARFREKRFKSGRRQGSVRVPGRNLDFTQDEFRWFFLLQLGGKADGCGKCNYCNVPLDALNIGFDHMIPVSRGGDLALINLAPTCDSCNRLKGQLTDKEFVRFRQILQQAVASGDLGFAGMADIEKRLKGQAVIFHKDRAKQKEQREATARPREMFGITNPLTAEDDF